MLRKKNSSIIISYLNLRRLIGIVAIILPFICFLGGLVFGEFGLERSISYYYYTNMRDVLVGMMVCLSVFFMTYKGYEKLDNVITHVIGISCLGVALFPCLFSENENLYTGLFLLPQQISQYVHFLFASVFFLLLAVNSIFIFTLTQPGNKITDQKRLRNAIYIICGIIIIILLLSMFILLLILGRKRFNEYPIAFILESLALFAFGFSWIVKGKTILQDK